MNALVRTGAALAGALLVVSGLVHEVPVSAAVVGGTCSKPGSYTVLGSRVLMCQASRVWKVHSRVSVNKGCPRTGLKAVVASRSMRCTQTPRGKRWVITTATPSPTSAPTQTQTPTPVESYAQPTQPSAAIELCQIPEDSDNRRRFGSIIGTGFPTIEQFVKHEGTYRWALIPLDFADLPGESNFRARVDGQMSLLTEWYQQVSGGRLTIEWDVHDSWVRLPGKMLDYDLNFRVDRPSDNRSIEEFWRRVIAVVDQQVDLTGIQVVNFILPKGQTIVPGGVQSFPWEQAMRWYNSRVTNLLGFTLPGQFFDDPERTYWSYWAHEYGHLIGLAHVGTSYEWSNFHGYDILGSQDGPTRDLSGWMRFIAGWLSDDQVYCQEIAQLQPTELMLSPLPSDGDGFKIAVIRTSPTKAVVVDSRRVSRWSCTTRANLTRQGVMVYTYDGTLGHYTEFLQPALPPGVSRGAEAPCGHYDLVFEEGQTATLEGVRVDVVRSGQWDRIRISRVP